MRRSATTLAVVLGLGMAAGPGEGAPAPIARAPAPGLLAPDEAASRGAAAQALAAWKPATPSDAGAVALRDGCVPGLGTLMLTGDLHAGWEAAWPQALADMVAVGLAIAPVGPPVLAARAAIGLGGIAASHAGFGAWASYGRTARHDEAVAKATKARRAELAATLARLDRLAKDRSIQLEAGLASAKAFERRRQYVAAVARLDGLPAPLPEHPRVAPLRTRLAGLAADAAARQAAAEERARAKGVADLKALGGLAVEGGKAAATAAGWAFQGLKWLDQHAGSDKKR